MMMKKIAVIGGDRRMLEAAARLADLGFECAVYGAPDGKDVLPGSLTRAATLADALSGAFTALAPIPLSRDRVHVNLPDFEPALSVRELILSLSPDQFLYAGSIDGECGSLLERRGIGFADLCEIPEYAYANAYATAEASLGLLISNMGMFLRDSDVAIFGGGRIAKFLAPMLAQRGARTYVFARSADQRAYFAAQGCAAGDFLPPRTPFADALVNTVPALTPIGPEEILRPDGLLLELCAIRREECPGVRLLRAPSLPGRFCYRSMGRILSDTLLSRIGRDGSKEM